MQVTDNRGFGADWTASVSSTNFVTGGGSPAEIIPAANAAYAVSGLTSATGPATFQVSPSIALEASPQPVVSATNVAGNTAVSWNPLIAIAVPDGAVGGNYSAIIVHSTS